MPLLTSKNISSDGVFTPSIPVDCSYRFILTGTWSGRITIQRSVTGGTEWTDIHHFLENTDLTFYDRSEKVLYRAGFRVGDYTSGTASVAFYSVSSADPFPDYLKASETDELYEPLSDGALTKNIDTPDLTDNTYTIVDSDCTVLIDDDDADVTGTVVVALPEAVSSEGRILTIKKIGSSQDVQLDGYDSETIDGSATQTITTQYNSLTVHCDGTEWHII